MSRGTSIQGPGTGQETEVELLRAMAAAPSLAEQRAIGARLAAYRADRAAIVRAEREVDLSARAVEQLYPTSFAGPGVRTTAASDWLGEVDDPEQVDLGEVTQQMVAAASLWYRRVPEAVRADQTEFLVQADGMACHEAARHGEHAPPARRAFLDHVEHLYGRRVLANEVPQLPSQFPPGSGLAPAVDNPQTFDDSLWGPAGPADPGTALGPPSLTEGGPVEGDVAQPVTNPAAFDTHDAAKPGVRPAVDYLDGTQTPPGWGQGLTTMTSLVPARARQLLAETAPGAPGVVVEPHPSSAQDQLTPSQQEGGPVEGDVAPTGAPPVDLAPHDAGPGNGPAVDEWDGQQYPFGAPGLAGPTAQPMAARRPLSAIVAAVRPRTLPPPAWPFLTALSHLRDASESFGAVSGRAVVEALLRTGGTALPSDVVAELRGHLALRVAGDLPPWLKGKDGEDDDGDDDPSSKDDDPDASDSSGDDPKDESDDDDDDDDSDDDEEKKTSAFRARVAAGLAARGRR